MATKLDPAAAPFSPSTAEPPPSLDLVTPHLDDDDKPPASFTRLPVELKEQIVADIQASYYATALEQPALSGNETIRLGPALADAERLIEVLPRRAEQVRSLVIQGGDEPTSRSPVEERQAHTEHNKMTRRIMYMCRHAEEVELHDPRPAQLAKVVFPVASTLIVNSYYEYDEVDRCYGSLWNFIVRQPRLTSLALYARAGWTSPQRLPWDHDDVCAFKVPHLLSFLPGLKHLCLSGSAVTCMDALQDWSRDDERGKLVSTLESLVIVVDRDKPSLSFLHDFISLFAPTLKTLDLDFCSDWIYDGDFDNPIPQFALPCLSSLTISTHCSDHIYSHFLSPTTPVTYFKIGVSSGLNRLEDLSALLAFLRAHGSTLRRVWLTDAFFETDWTRRPDGQTPASLAAIVECCASLGVEVGPMRRFDELFVDEQGQDSATSGVQGAESVTDGT
ncbi:hypothetical protein JCM8208_000785 [Rhodotorula glutinis]